MEKFWNVSLSCISKIVIRKFYAGTGGRKFDRRSYTCGLALRLIRGSSCERRGQAPSFLGSNDLATKMFHVGWSYPAVSPRFSRGSCRKRGPEPPRNRSGKLVQQRHGTVTPRRRLSTPTTTVRYRRHDPITASWLAYTRFVFERS